MTLDTSARSHVLFSLCVSCQIFEALFRVQIRLLGQTVARLVGTLLESPTESESELLTGKISNVSADFLVSLLLDGSY